MKVEENGLFGLLLYAFNLDTHGYKSEPKYLNKKKTMVTYWCFIYIFVM